MARTGWNRHPIGLSRVFWSTQQEKQIAVSGSLDVWETEEACRRFGEILAPILQEVGIDVPPEIYPAHAFVSA